MIKEVFEKRRIETFENGEMPSKFNLLTEKSESKTFRGFLNGCLRKSVNSGNKEMTIFFRELIKKFNEFYPQNIIKNEIEIIDGWKGIGSLEAFEGFDKDFIIKEHIKDKETGEVKATHHSVPRENVNRLFFWIKKWEVGESHKCYDFAPIIGEQDWKEVWKKRTDVYFPKYYYPIKILEALDIIKYSGRGNVTRLK